jgi:hypothetical protein
VIQAARPIAALLQQLMRGRKRRQCSTKLAVNPRGFAGWSGTARAEGRLGVVADATRRGLHGGPTMGPVGA